MTNSTAVLERRSFALESAVAPLCMESGARVSLNVRAQDIDLAAPDSLDIRSIQIVADGLHVFHAAQLAVDTTLVFVMLRWRGRLASAGSQTTKEGHVP